MSRIAGLAAADAIQLLGGVKKARKQKPGNCML